MGRVNIVSTENANDKFGGGWVIFKTTGGIVSLYYALSASYAPSSFPVVKSNSWNGVQDKMDEFAEAHQTLRVGETWYRDQNSVDWIEAYDKGLVSDDYIAGTRAYNGALITEKSEGELHGEILLFAEEKKDLVKVDPPKPPPPPVVDPTKPPVTDPTKPPVVQPPPAPPPSSGPGVGTVLIGGVAIAALLYALRD